MSGNSSLDGVSPLLHFLVIRAQIYDRERGYKGRWATTPAPRANTCSWCAIAHVPYWTLDLGWVHFTGQGNFTCAQTAIVQK